MRLTPASVETLDEWLSVWLALSVTAGLAVGIVTWVATGSVGVFASTTSLTTLMAAIPGFASRGLTQRAARIWSRAGRAAGRRLTRVLLAIMYYLIVWPVSHAGDSLGREGFHDGSVWRRRDRLPGHGPSFASWSAGRGDGWVVFLMPFLALLRSFEAQLEGESPDGIYTLF